MSHRTRARSRLLTATVATSTAALAAAALATPVGAAPTPSAASPAAVSPSAAVGPDGLPRSPELTETTRLADRRAVVIGERAYSTWTEDGLYPAAGFHTRGEMGGFWSPPVKLLDGLWFSVDGRWLGGDVQAERFASGTVRAVSLASVSPTRLARGPSGTTSVRCTVTPSVAAYSVRV